jgi:TolB protein
MRRTAYITVWIIIFIFSSLHGEEKVYLDISGATFKRIPVAVPKFISKNGKQDKLSVVLQKELEKALNYTDLFEIIGEDNYLINPLKEGIKTSEINFENWKTIGVELLIKGNYKYDGNLIVVEIRAYDPYQGKFVFGRRYRLDNKNIVKAVYKSVNELLEAITGKKGVLGTKIAFQYRAPGERRKDIYIINIDGTGFKRITMYNRITMFPDWFPNGKKLVFSGFVKSYPDIFIANLIKGAKYGNFCKGT